MRRSVLRSLLVMCWLISSCVLAPNTTIFGQTNEPDPAAEYLQFASTPKALPPSAPAVAPAAVVTADNPRFIPIVNTGIVVQPLQFSTQVDAQTGAPINPATTFDYGVKSLYVSSIIGNAEEQKYGIEVTFPDGKVVGGQADFTVFDSPYSVAIVFCRTSGFRCGDSGTVALPRGTYKARIYVSNTQFREANATVK